MATPHPRSFGELLRRYRIAAGLTQEELAERAGLSRRAVGSLETGERLSPHRETVSLLSKALNLPPAEQALLESTARQRLLDARDATNLAPGTAPRRPSPGQLGRPLVGRQQELAALGRHLAGEGPPLLMLAGEAGVGKSRLLDEAIRLGEAQGWTVLTGGCHRRSGQQPYVPFVSALTRFLAARSPAQQRLDLQGCAWLARLLPELAGHVISPAPIWTLPPEQERRLVFNAVGRFLANVARPAGTLLILDDLHWAGDEALDLLAALIQDQDTGSKPLRIVGAYRDTDVVSRDLLPLLLGDLTREGQAIGLRLQTLDREAARELLTELLTSQPGADDDQDSQQAIQPELVDVAIERSSGLPLFLVSWAQELRTGIRSADAAGSVVPWSAAESIRQRIAALSRVAQDVLSVAAVAGRRTPARVLLAAANVAGHNELDTLSGLDDACRARLLADGEDGSYAFTHDLVRETIVRELGQARRALLHRCVALALEAQPLKERHAAELAWHFAEGDEPAHALPYALQAGVYARETYAHEDAARHFRMAAQLARTLGDRADEAEALERLGDVLYNLGHVKDVQATLESAATLRKEIGQIDQHAWDTAHMTRAYISMGQAAEALERLRALLATLVALASHDTHDVVGRTGAAPHPQQLGASLDDLEEQAARAATALTTRTAARVYVTLTASLFHLERYEEAIPLGEQAVFYSLKAGEDWMHARAQAFLGGSLEAVGKVDRAVAAFEAGGAAAEKARDLEGIILNYGNLGGVYQRQGAFDRAIPYLTRTWEGAEQFGVPEFIVQAASGLAEMAYLTGDWGQVRGYCERAREAIRESDVLTDAAWPLFVLGTLCLAQGDAQEARAYLDEAIVLGERGSNYPVLRAARAAAAEQELLNGDAQAAYDRLASLDSRPQGQREYAVDSMSMIALVPLLAWAHVEMGDLNRAETILTDVLALVTDRKQNLALADVLRVEAILAMRRGHLEEARLALDEAIVRSRQMPYPYAEAKALYIFGQLHLMNQERDLAREKYRAALAILHRLGERLYAHHIERALAGLAER